MKKKNDALIIKKTGDIILDLKLFLDYLDPSLWNKWHDQCNLTVFPFFSNRNERLEVPDDLMENEGLKSLLLNIINKDDWKDHSEIDMKKNHVNKSYVESYLNQANELQDEVCQEHQSELKLLVYYAVATRFYIERTLHKTPLPSTKVSADKAMEDYILLKKTPGQILNFGSSTGQKAANFFMEDVRYKCPAEGKTFAEYCNQPILIGKLVTWMKKYNEISNASFNRIKRDTVVSPFRPAAVKYLVHYIHENDSDIKISSYLNLCGGWGCRLVGALSTPEITRYIQTDPNPELLPISKKIHEAYDPGKETEVHLYDKPMEDLTVDQLCPDGKKNQLIFFSPPFYNKEKYHGELQSYQRYPKLETWCNEFLYKSLQVSYFSLENGILAINLANILSSNGNEIKLTDCLVHLLDVTMANYFTKFIDPAVYPNKNAPPSYIYIYKTKPYRDSLGIYPKFEWETKWVLKKVDRPQKGKNIKVNPTTTTSTQSLAIKQHATTSSRQEHLVPHAIASKPSINDITLANLHQCIERLNTLKEVADNYGCSPTAVIRRISDWDLKLSYEKLKYNYASSESRSIYFYNNWHVNKNVLYIDNQPFNPNVIYLSFINRNPLNPNGFITGFGSNTELLQVICANPRGALVSHTINVSQCKLTDVSSVVSYLVDQGLIKKWMVIPHYNECKSNQRFGIEHLSLTLEEFHELILSEQDELNLCVRLGKPKECLELDLSMMNSSLEELKNITPSEASIRYGDQYKECIGTIIANKLQQESKLEAVSSANEEFEEAPVEKEETTQVFTRPARRMSTFKSGFFIPKPNVKTKRDDQEADSNKKSRYG
jgi:hypothetical protein